MKKIIFLLVGLILPLLAATQANSPAGDHARYTVILVGNKAGFATSSRNPDGSLQFYYEFNDRGRGPKVTEHVVLDSNGIPIQIDNTGIDYEKAPVDEHFTIKGGSAKWKNRAEHGDIQISGKAFYVSISGAPHEGAILARALLANGGRLPLLPAGEASIEKRGELKSKPMVNRAPSRSTPFPASISRPVPSGSIRTTPSSPSFLHGSQSFPRDGNPLRTLF
jgi:hypothetical protein